MVQNSKQDWSIGGTVKVGFLSLTVVAKVATPGDGMPDAYILSSKTAFYEFIPHNGLNKITAGRASEMVAAGIANAARIAHQAVARADQHAAHQAKVRNLVSRALA